ncbi:unnamed protein product [Arctogadus glacialis]
MTTVSAFADYFLFAVQPKANVRLPRAAQSRRLGVGRTEKRKRGSAEFLPSLIPLERLSGAALRSGSPERLSGAALRSGSPERLSGAALWSGSLERLSGAALRSGSLERLSGAALERLPGAALWSGSLERL